MIKLLLRIIVLVALITVQLGCSYETRTPQFSVAIYVDRTNGAALRTAVESYAKSHGYIEKKVTSIQDELSRQGIVLWSFHAVDSSFISLTNAVVLDCYDLSVYSANDAGTARAVVLDLTEFLDRGAGALRVDSSGAPCSKR